MPLEPKINNIDYFSTGAVAYSISTNRKVNAYSSGIAQLVLDMPSYFAPTMRVKRLSIQLMAILPICIDIVAIGLMGK
jgi:hypothetical protein